MTQTDVVHEQRPGGAVVDTQYEDLLRRVLETGAAKSDRTGTGTRSVFGHQMRFDLAAGFPLVTTKRVHLRSVVAELLWFLRGDGNARRAGQLRRSGRAGRSRDGGSDGCPDAGLYRGLQSRSQIRTYTKILSLRCAERGFSFMTGSAAKGGGAVLILCCPARSPWQNS